MAFTPDSFEYHEWLVKTNFSFLMGASHPKEVLQTAIALDYQSLCINDFDGAYGLARTFNTLKKIRQTINTPIKLNYGCELRLSKNFDSPLLKQKSLALVAMNWDGYRNLNTIISHAQRHGKGSAFIDIEELSCFDVKGLFGIVPMRNIDLSSATNMQKWGHLQEMLSGRLHFAITKTYNIYSDRMIPKTMALAKKLACSVLFSQDAFYHDRRQKSFHDLLCAIRTNTVISEAIPHFLPNGERSLHEKSFLWKTYSRFPQFQQTLRHMSFLNEQCNFCLSELHYQYPKEMIPEGFTAQSYLEKMTWEDARQIYGDNLPPKIVTLLSKELNLIEELEFADYFLTVWDIVRWARSQNILCQGRGSAANSAVCFVLGITSCNPSQFELLFERFISKERGDPPDIDVDFEHERREEVLQYIYRRYGRKKAAMVANVITFQKKGALRATGKALGIHESLLSAVSKSVSTVSSRGKATSEVLKGFQASTPKRFQSSIPWSLWQDFATRLRGFPRHLGLHSGGFVISQHSIDSLVPQEPATMEGRTVIQWCKEDIENLGFFKIDCLSLGMLTALRKCFDLVETYYNRKLQLRDIPNDDTATYTMIQKADTVGVFQIESRAQMSMLPRLKPKCFYDLVIEIAIIRPGPIQGKVIHPYLKRRNGLEPVTYPDPRVKEALSKTLGVVIFQEQAMRIAMALGNFTPGEANELRKHIGSWGSKDFGRNLNPYMQKLFRSLKQQNIDPKFIFQLLEQMKGFAHYGFPESHAISFAFLAYASSYLKCHYPAAFFTSILNSQPMGFYSPHALLQAAQRHDVQVLPISVNHSLWDHQLEPLTQKKGRPPIYGIRLGFRLVKGLRKRTAEALCQARTDTGPWRDFDGFVKDTAIPREDYTALAASGAFACLGLQRFEALWKSEAIPMSPMVDIEERRIQWSERDQFQKTQMDFEAFGTTLEDHPVLLIKKEYWPYKVPLKALLTSQAMEPLQKNSYVTFFGMILIKQAPPSAKGMVFLTLEDDTGFINLAFSPHTYQKFAHTLEHSVFLCGKGKLQKVQNYHSILVTEVYTEDRSQVIQLYNKNKVEISKSKIPLRPRNYY